MGKIYGSEILRSQRPPLTFAGSNPPAPFIMTYTVLDIRATKKENSEFMWVDFEYVRDADGVVHMPESKLCPIKQIQAIDLKIGDKVAL